MSLSISRRPYLSVHQASAPPPTAPLNWPKVLRRPRHLVADRQRPQHHRDDAGETADADDRDRDGAGAGRRGAAAVDQRTGARPDAIALGLGARAVQGLEGDRAGLFQDAPKHFEPVVVRRKSVLRQGEVDRHEARPRPAQSVE